MNTSSYPLWVAPLAPGHIVANVREMRRGPDGEFFFVRYAEVLRKNGFGPNDWDRFVLDG